MRNEQQMLELILSTARQDERIRAVILEGSRTNPKAPRDIFQDYDVVYVVGETGSFRQDKGWSTGSASGFICSTPRITRCTPPTKSTVMVG